MSDGVLNPDVPAELREILARIDRDLAESAKLRQESEKFIAEQRKLIAEAAKLDRDRWWAPLLAVVAIISGLITVGGALWHALHGG